MDKDLHDDDMLARYLDGEMDAAAQDLFQEELNNNIFLRERLETMQLAIEAIRQGGTVERVHSVHQEMMKELSQPVKKKTSVYIMVGMRVAAAIVIILFSTVIYTFTLSSQKIFDENYLNYSVSNSRGNLDTPGAAFQLFAEGRYNQVIRHTSADTEPLNKLLRSISFINTNKSSFAIPLLKELQANDRYKEDADYYLAMAYVKNDQPGKAYDEMKKISDNEGHAYQRQVSGSMMRKIKLLAMRKGD